MSDRGPSPSDDRRRSGGVGSRRESRERALALLYEADAKQVLPTEVLAALPVPAEQFTAEVVEGVAVHLDEIDDLIRSYSHEWRLERMPAVDRALLRMSVFELCYSGDVPIGSVISEAVELAKRYSTEESGRFINGMLSAIARAVRGDTGLAR